MINIKPPRRSPVTNTPSVYSPPAETLPLCLCRSSSPLSLPSQLSRWPAESALFGPCVPSTLLIPHSLFLSLSLFLSSTSQEKNLEWFPRMRAMSLVSSEGDNEQNEMRSLQEKLDSTVTLVSQLSGQLSELKEQVEFNIGVFFFFFSFSFRAALGKALWSSELNGWWSIWSKILLFLWSYNCFIVVQYIHLDVKNQISPYFWPNTLILISRQHCRSLTKWSAAFWI